MLSETASLKVASDYATSGKENGNNRIKAYFESSSFLQQQYEIAMFIKNFPIIKVSQVDSINALISLLIKQNEMLGTKCEQNISMVKEMYLKHEGLIKSNKQLRMQLQAQTAQQGKRAKIAMDYEAQLEKLGEQLRGEKGKQDITEKLITDYKMLCKEMAEIINTVVNGGYKTMLDKLKNQAYYDQIAIQRMEWKLPSREELQNYFKEQKRRSKCLPKIKEAIGSFCSRLNRIVKVVPYQILGDNFERQTQAIRGIVEQLLMKSSRKYNGESMSSHSRGSFASDYFQGLIKAVVQQKETDDITKQQIIQEVAELNRQLTDSKSNYEAYLTSLKLQLEQEKRKCVQESNEKEHFTEFYKEQLNTFTLETMRLKKDIEELQNELTVLKKQFMIKQQEAQTAQNKLKGMQQILELKQQQFTEKIHLNTRTQQYKLSKKDQLIQEENRLRQEDKLKFEARIQEERQKIETKQQIILKLEAELRETQSYVHERVEKIKELESKILISEAVVVQQRNKQQIERQKWQVQKNGLTVQIQKYVKQIHHLRQEVSQNEREQQLQANYIKELEKKNSDQLSQIKVLEAKKSDEKTAKKELNNIKQALSEENRHNKQVQESFLHQREQNARLKALLKEMKNELKDAYEQLKNLKAIQIEREQLLTEMDQSARAKNDLLTEYQTMKMQIFRLEKQKNGLLLEVKHYKSALNRIEALK